MSIWTNTNMQHATTGKPRLLCQRLTLLAASAKCCGGEEQKKSKERFTKFLASLNTEEIEGFSAALRHRQWRVGLVSGRGLRASKRVLFQLSSAAPIKGWHNTNGKGGGIKINDSCFGTNGISAVFSHRTTGDDNDDEEDGYRCSFSRKMGGC